MKKITLLLLGSSLLTASSVLAVEQQPTETETNERIEHTAHDTPQPADPRQHFEPCPACGMG